MDEDRILKHPSFGILRLSHISGHSRLFGSSVRHSNYMGLSICRAVHRRGLHHDDIVADSGRELIRVYMSPVQLSEALFSVGSASGAPCTISGTMTTGWESYKEPPATDSQSVYVEEFKKDMADVAGKMDEALNLAEEQAAKPSVNKTERNKLLGMLRSIKQHLECNMPFVLESYVEKVETVKQQAKGEIEARADLVVRTLGQQALDVGLTKPTLLEGPPADEKA
jgi:hypothetical protein